MSNRINQSHLMNLLNRINKAAGANPKAWSTVDNRWTANVGTYALDWAYGGVCLVQMMNESGGERNITQRASKRETYWQMDAFLLGLEADQKRNK